MARGSVTVGPVSCPSCGAKFSAGRSRCPRCRAVIAAPDPAGAGKRSQRLMLASAALVVVVGAGLLFLWYSGSSPTSSGASGSTAPSAPRTAGAALEPEFLDWRDSVGGSPELQKMLEEHQKHAAENPKAMTC